MLVEDARRLEKIDKLHQLRLDQYISLPMLTVVGDQSSGKSSVLEALTGLPLPRDSGLCTRFPTQIIFKRSRSECVEVSIIPSSEPSAQKKSRLLDFAARHSGKGLISDPSAFPHVLREASDIMGVPAAGTTSEEGMTSFSNDILKIEMSGSQHEHFSVIDLPGLFRKPTPSQTTKEDMVIVRQMVSSYLNNQRAIILAVVPANVDLATQEIIQMAEDADSERNRTLGVLTKPDLVDRGAESSIIDLLRDERQIPGLGYTMVCNRSQSNLGVSLLERNFNESRFFCIEPWSTIPKHRVGISALKQRLNDLLVRVTRSTFTDVSLEIDNRLRQAQQDLDRIGLPRGSPADQRLFLLQIATSFQSLASKAIDAYYGRDDCFQQFETLRLATLIITENEKFSQTMFRHGSRRKFSLRSESESEDEQEISQGSPATNMSESMDQDNTEEIDKRFPELRSLRPRAMPNPDTHQESVEDWISRMYRNFKGFEVGTTNPSLLPSLIREQTCSWEFYAMSHVHNVILHIHTFLHDLLRHVCLDSTIRDRVWTRIAAKLKTAYATAIDHVHFLVKVETTGFPVTLNHYFTDNLKKRRLSRIEKRLQKMKSWHTNDEVHQPLLRLADTLQAYVSNEQHSVEDLHDVLKSYHKVARKRFVDAVCKQVIDYHLICSPEGPLWILSPQFVALLKEDELQHLAGEDNDTLIRRKSLRLEIESLIEGQAIIQT